jgi:hypothetical protein
MDTRFTRAQLLALALASSLIWPASGASLYKVVGADGAIAFTDVPPPPGSGTVSEIPMRETTKNTTGAMGVPQSAGAPRYEFTVADDAVQLANARVDAAEHALALARQGVWSPRDGLSLTPDRMARADWNRVDYYKRDVQFARQQLMDLLRQRPVLATR